MASTLTSSLIVKLIDQVSGPATKAAGALRGLNSAASYNGGKASFDERMAAAQGRLTTAISANNVALGDARMKLFDAFIGWQVLDRTIGSTVRTAADFETAMNKVAAVSGATGGELEALTRQAAELGRTTQFTASEAADAMGFLAMAGFGANEILGAMPGTLQLAASAQLDLGRAADIVSNILTGYGKDVEDLGHVNDVLVKAFTSANTDLTQLGEAMKYAGPVASAAGVEFEATAAALALMGNAGIQASMAGTSLRGAISRILSPTKQVSNAMDAAGLSFTDAAGKLRPLDEIIQQLEPHAEDAGLFMELFGQRAGPAMAALVTQGADAMRELTGELENSGGTAERIANVQMAGFNGMVKEWKSAAEGLSIAIGNTLLPALTEIGKHIIPLMGSITGLIEAHPELTAAVVATTGAFVGLRVATAALTFAGLLGKGGALSMLAGAFGLVRWAARPVAGMLETIAMRSTLAASALGRPPGVLSRLGDALLVFGNAVTAPVGGLKSLAMWAGRLSIPLAVLAGAAKFVIDNFEGIQSMVGGFFDGFLSNLDTTGIEKIGSAFAPLGDILKPVGDAFGVIYGFIAGDSFDIGASTEEWRGWGEVIGGGVAQGVNAVVGGINALIEGIVNAIGLAQDLGNAIASLWGAGGGGGTNNPSAVINGQVDPGLPAPSGHRASGGPVWPGGSFLVGENEAEIFTPKTSGTITPLSGVGGGPIQLGPFYFSGLSGDPAELKRAVSEAAEDAIQSLLRGAHVDAGAR